MVFFSTVMGETLHRAHTIARLHAMITPSPDHDEEDLIGSGQEPEQTQTNINAEGHFIET